MLERFLPLIFVLFWSTGFIGSKLGAPHIEPFTFLAIRFSITLAILSLIILVMKPEFPEGWKIKCHVFYTGLLIHAVYLYGVFLAIKLGLPTGIAAAIVGFQPVLTTLIIHKAKAPLLIGVALLGFAGLLMVVLDEGISFSGVTWQVYLPCFLSLLGITLGTIHLKKYCGGVNLITLTWLQYIPTFLVLTAGAFIFERGATINWTGELVFAILWLAVVLSIGAVILMSYLYKKRAANVVASYFFLTPPVTLIMGYVLFDERIHLINLLGFALVVASIYLTKKLEPTST